MIYKRKKELGIYRSLGYTTLQLMSQISLSFMPVVIAGVALGGLLGKLYTNKVLSILLSVNFTIPPLLVAAICILLIVLAYAVSMTVARGIRKITVYRLITE